MDFQEYSIDNLPEPGQIKRPTFVHELKSIVQPIKLLTRFSKLTKNKIGNGEKVMLFPGWKSPESSMYPMKKFLTELGYSVSYWGLGFNNGRIEDYRDEIVQQLKEEESTEKITLIGWSLGGVIAREVARELPERIASVVTYGTPLIGGPKYTIGAKYWGEKEIERITALFDELNTNNPIQVPISIIFTKSDSFVSWSACLDHHSLNVQHYEVSSTHLSLGVDPQVWGIVAMHMLENK